MRNIFKMVAIASILVIILTASLASVATAAGNGAGKGSTSIIQVAPLSDQEKADLLLLREEEKLARDVYLELFDTWNLPIFKNIATSEQKHMDATKKLLDKYGIADPALAQGEFTEQSELQSPYNDLILKGSQSQIDALEVGVLIEEIDIEDLNTAIAAATHKDIKIVYGNLLEGSLNHLAAFNSHLD